MFYSINPNVRWRKRKDFFFELLKAFVVPAIFILITIVVLLNFVDINNKETSNVVLGVMLGVILGFCADLIKRGLDEFIEKQELKEISFRLLEEDAENIYRLIWISEWLQKSNQIPEDVKKQTPPMIMLNYWNFLKRDKEFLLLGINEPFNEIFKYMWDFEKINSEIRLAERGDKEAANIAVKLYKITVEKGYHKKFLLLFKTEQEIKELDKKYTDRKTQSAP